MFKNNFYFKQSAAGNIVFEELSDEQNKLIDTEKKKEVKYFLTIVKYIFTGRYTKSDYENKFKSNIEEQNNEFITKTYDTFLKFIEWEIDKKFIFMNFYESYEELIKLRKDILKLSKSQDYLIFQIDFRLVNIYAGRKKKTMAEEDQEIYNKYNKLNIILDFFDNITEEEKEYVFGTNLKKKILVYRNLRYDYLYNSDIDINKNFIKQILFKNKIDKDIKDLETIIKNHKEKKKQEEKREKEREERRRKKKEEEKEKKKKEKAIKDNKYTKIMEELKKIVTDKEKIINFNLNKFLKNELKNDYNDFISTYESKLEGLNEVLEETFEDLKDKNKILILLKKGNLKKEKERLFTRIKKYIDKYDIYKLNNTFEINDNNNAFNFVYNIGNEIPISSKVKNVLNRINENDIIFQGEYYMDE
jgi:hypothetical protein